MSVSASSGGVLSRREPAAEGRGTGGICCGPRLFEAQRAAEGVRKASQDVRVLFIHHSFYIYIYLLYIILYTYLFYIMFFISRFFSQEGAEVSGPVCGRTLQPQSQLPHLHGRLPEGVGPLLGDVQVGVGPHQALLAELPRLQGALRVRFAGRLGLAIAIHPLGRAVLLPELQGSSLRLLLVAIQVLSPTHHITS